MKTSCSLRFFPCRSSIQQDHSQDESENQCLNTNSSLEEILVRRMKQQSAGVIFLFFTADRLFQQRITHSNNYIHKLSKLFNRCQCTSDTAQVVGCFSSSFSKRQKPFLRQTYYFTFLYQKKSTMTVILLNQVKNNLQYKCHLLLMFSKASLLAPHAAAVLIQFSGTNF